MNESPFHSTLRLVEFGLGKPAPARDLSFLQRELLPTSPACAWGPRFLEKFYFTVLPNEGLLFGTAAYYQDQPVGLTVGSLVGRRFISLGARRRPFLLSSILLPSLIQDPRRVRLVFDSLRIMRAKNADKDSNYGQWLTTAVLPDFTGAEFRKRTGLRIASEMSNRTMMQFYRAGVPKVFAYMDADNTRSRERGVHRGWVLSREVVPEWPRPCVEYACRPAEFLRTNGLLDSPAE